MSSDSLAWRAWSDDPLAAQTGVSFDRRPAGKISAPPAKFRVCAYHIDFDERPTAYVDVDSLGEAQRICEKLSSVRGDFNVDYAQAFDERGKLVVNGRPW